MKRIKRFRAGAAAPGGLRHPRVAAVVALMVVLAAACGVTYGRITENRDAAVLMGADGGQPDRVFFIYGRTDRAVALAQVWGGYRVASRIWQETDADTARAALAGMDRHTRGFDILGPEGALLGRLVTRGVTVTVGVDAGTKTVNLAPHLRVGGDR